MGTVELVRGYLKAHARDQTAAATLEQIAGVDRFTIARHFRRAYGTSPDRYRTMRRLAIARKAIEQGTPLAEAAAEAGFADQSYMTRQFKRTYGLTPGTENGAPKGDASLTWPLRGRRRCAPQENDRGPH